MDDNEDAAETLADVLRCSGYEVRTAHDPHAALEQAESFGPHVAVLDIGLPTMDGWALGARLRERHPDLHRLAVTGYGMESDRARTREAGFVAHLVKPLDLERLDRILAGLMAAGGEGAVRRWGDVGRRVGEERPTPSGRRPPVGLDGSAEPLPGVSKPGSESARGQCYQT